MMDTRAPIFQALARDQRGASYSVSVLLILPIYIAALAFTIEFVFMLNAELAVSAAEESAVHAVKCWYPHRDVNDNEGATLDAEVHRAVVRAMIPFAPVGRPQDERDASLDHALRASGLPPKAIERYGAKYAALQRYMIVKVTPMEQPVSGFEVVLRYEAPLFFDFFSAILANGSNAFGPIRIHEKKIFIPLSERQTQTTHLGIPYSPREAMQW